MYVCTGLKPRDEMWERQDHRQYWTTIIYERIKLGQIKLNIKKRGLGAEEGALPGEPQGGQILAQHHAPYRHSQNH